MELVNQVVEDQKGRGGTRRRNAETVSVGSLDPLGPKEQKGEFES